MVHFELLRDKILGEGSFGKVYQCRWYGCPAAVKLFNAAHMDSDQVSQEIALIKELCNDYIIQFFGTVQHNGKLCLVTSYAERGSLHQALSRHNLPEKQKPRIIWGLIKGMLYLKSSKVVHRDLKSPNVLLDLSYIPKICDFGLAKLKLNSTAHTTTSSSMGTTRWMAPELFQKRPRYSFASDIYALGIVMWEVLTEKLPYYDTVDIGTIINFIKAGEHEDIPDSIPEQYKFIIKSCWHMDPERRITIEEISEMHDLDPTQIAITSDSVTFNDDVPASLISCRHDSGYMSSQHQSADSSDISERVAPTEQMPTDYETILNEYLLQTSCDLHNKKHLALVLDTHDDGLTKWIKAAAAQGNADAATILGEMYYHGCGVPQDYQAALEQFSLAAKEEDRTANDVTKHRIARAQNSLGWMYDFGQGVQQNFEEAFQWYTNAAANGNIAAIKNLAWLFANGQGVPQSDDKAFELFTKAAEQDNAAAKNGLGWMYTNGLGVPQNDEKAVEWYRKSAEQDDAMAQYNLGWMYEEGRGVPQNDEKAVEWYMRAAEQGDAMAQYNLGRMYENGRGVPQNDDKAVEWYRKAAEQGDTDAQNSLGWMYKNSRGAQQSDEKAVEWWTKAAEQGNAAAQTNLGWMYESGQGVLQNDTVAAFWYTKAAEQNHVSAQNSLGQMYYHGQGVLQNDNVAAFWYTKAAEQGNADAQNSLGKMYEYGRGVRQSDEKAVEWYTKAAEQGHASAQFNLGWRYRNGRGVPQNYEKAVEWYRKAAEQRNAVSRKSLKQM